MGKTINPKHSPHLIDMKVMQQPSAYEEINPSSYGSPKAKNPYNDRFSKTDAEAMAQIVKQKQFEQLLPSQPVQ